jgi:hypothetical protein
MTNQLLMSELCEKSRIPFSPYMCLETGQPLMLTVRNARDSQQPARDRCDSRPGRPVVNGLDRRRSRGDVSAMLRGARGGYGFRL